MNEADELLLLMHQMHPRKRKYLALIAAGYSDGEACEELGIKLDTVATTWVYHAKHNKEFARALEIMRTNPTAVDVVNQKRIYSATLRQVAEELDVGYFSPKYGRFLQPRTETLRMGMEIGDLAKRAGAGNIPQLPQQVLSIMAGAVAIQLQQLGMTRNRELEMTPDMIKELRDSKE